MTEQFQVIGPGSTCIAFAKIKTDMSSILWDQASPGISHKGQRIGNVHSDERLLVLATVNCRAEDSHGNEISAPEEWIQVCAMDDMQKCWSDRKVGWMRASDVAT